MKRLGLVLTAPFVLLLVALPVGFVMELGKQVRFRVVNAGPRPLHVTLLADDPLRVARQTIHPFLPLPAFRAVDLPLPPGAARVVYYSGRRSAPRLVALRDGDVLRELPLPAAVARRDVETGREVVLSDASPALPASPAATAALAGHTQAYPWAVLLAGPLGTLAFLRIRRSLSFPPPEPPPAR